MTIGAFTNAILRNSSMTVCAAAVTAGVLYYANQKFGIIQPRELKPQREVEGQRKSIQPDRKNFTHAEVAAIAVVTLAVANLAYGLGGSVGNYFFDTSARWTVLKTLGQLSTQFVVGTLLSGAAFIGVEYLGLLKPGFAGT